MAEEETRVEFTAPASLVERVDSVVALLDRSREEFLVDALEHELEELANDEFCRHLTEAYHDERVDDDTVKAVLGPETAIRMRLLKSSIDKAAPEPQLADGLPSDDAFYDGDTPAWTEDGTDSSE